MANTYYQLYVQLIFSVKNRYCLINESCREEIQKYITGIIANNGCVSLAIYANPDHVHILTSIKPNILVSNLVRDIKGSTSRFINEKRFSSYHFQWQEGYGAFTYSQSQMESVRQYIFNQPEHHRKNTFKEEYIDFLNKFCVAYDDRFLFDWI